jgi:hypothetical protein
MGVEGSKPASAQVPHLTRPGSSCLIEILTPPTTFLNIKQRFLHLYCTANKTAHTTLDVDSTYLSCLQEEDAVAHGAGAAEEQGEAK